MITPRTKQMATATIIAGERRNGFRSGDMIEMLDNATSMIALVASIHD